MEDPGFQEQLAAVQKKKLLSDKEADFRQYLVRSGGAEELVKLLVGLQEAGSAPADWSLAKYGSIDIQCCLKLQLPVPRWIIPNAVLRWALPLVCRILYPLLLLLNEAFESTAFSERAREDKSSWFAAIRPRIERAQALLVAIPRTFSL